MRLGPALVVTFLLGPQPVCAAPITWNLDGQVTSSPSGNPLERDLPVGTSVSFVVAIDPAAPDLCEAAGAGFYVLPSAHVAFGASDYAASRVYLEANNPEGSCTAKPAGMTIRMFFDRAPFSAAVITWPAVGERLPLTPPSSAQFWVAYDYPGPTVSGRCQKRRANSGPSTVLMMLPALSAIVLGSRRRR